VTTIHASGDSTRPLNMISEILLARPIILLADIRTVPRSRHNSQFNRESLELELPKTKIE
jgi:hypothetical protein